MQLMATHILTGDIFSFQSHRKAVKQMIELRGGLGNSDAHLALRGFLGMNDIMALLLRYMASAMSASASGTPPTVPPSTVRHPALTVDVTSSPPPGPTYPKPPFSDSLLQAISKLPPGLQDLALTCTISTQMIKLLVQTTSWAEITTSTANPSATISKTGIYRLYCEPMETATACLSLLTLLPPMSTDPSLEHLLCLGLCLSIRGARNQARPLPSQVKLLADFVACLQSLTVGPLSVEAQDCVIWISFLAAYGSGDNRGFLKQKDTLIDHVLRTYHQMAANWALLENLLKRFLWFEHLGDDWKALWQRSVSRRVIS